MSSILVIGKPNSGKSLLFNRLTGMNQKVANFPGVTVEIKSSAFRRHRLIDLPGTYSLQPITPDERIAVKKFHETVASDEVKGVLCMLDCTRLERSLVFGLQAQRVCQEEGVPIMFALNMMDDVARIGETVDVEGLKQALNAEIRPISTKKKQGLDELADDLDDMIRNPDRFVREPGEGDGSDYLKRSHELHQRFGPDVRAILALQQKLDNFFLSGTFGGLVFVLIMLLLFQSIFTWATPLMDGVEGIIGWLAGQVSSGMSDGMVKDFIVDAMFGGVGSFLVFVPQIMVLTFIIGLLEDSGYLARASVLCHRTLSNVGLSGMSFVPYLSGFACAIPAMMVARNIPSTKRRLLTIITIPLMSCSARLPVYSLIILVLVPANKVFGGFVDLRGVIFFALYFLGIVAALVVSALLSKYVIHEADDAPFMLELPPYRLPSLKPLLTRAVNAGKTFITKAGHVIFAIAVIIWVLGYFPYGPGNLDSSYLGIMGKWIEPIFAPMDLDWRYGVAILASFAAREVFVGTLGTMFGIDGADENIAGLAANVQADGMSLASGAALLVFYVIALQCGATLAVMRKETGSNRIPIATFVGYSLLAYLAALLTYMTF
ncbi:MAG: ferrous iron transporter B [Proteobacteria bacterium]|jgi:ferrous iron transport protein B|nr:ferrous iron transporter B [Pseudomonadota bacterium]